MGLGAWLATMTDRKHYEVEEAREHQEIRDMPEAEEEEIYEIFDTYGIAREAVTPLVQQLKSNEDMWVKVSPNFLLIFMTLTVSLDRKRTSWLPMVYPSNTTYCIMSSFNYNVWGYCSVTLI
jgi:hypothetical protein